MKIDLGPPLPPAPLSSLGMVLEIPDGAIKGLIANTGTQDVQQVSQKQNIYKIIILIFSLERNSKISTVLHQDHSLKKRQSTSPPNKHSKHTILSKV